MWRDASNGAGTENRFRMRRGQWKTYRQKSRARPAMGRTGGRAEGCKTGEGSERSAAPVALGVLAVEREAGVLARPGFFEAAPLVRRGRLDRRDSGRHIDCAGRPQRGGGAR